MLLFKSSFSNPGNSVTNSFQVQGNQQQQLPSSVMDINQLNLGLRPQAQGTDALNAIAALAGMLLGDGTLVLGPDGRVRIQASYVRHIPILKLFYILTKLWAIFEKRKRRTKS